MGVVVDVDTESGRAQRMLREIADRGNDWQGVLGEVLLDFHKVEQRVFQQEAEPGGGSWPSLDRRYLEKRREQGLGTKMLQYEGGDGGKLRKSLTQPGAPHSYVRIDADTLQVGTKLGIAAVHQKGGRVAGSRIPQRRFVGVTDETRDRWAGILADHLKVG